MKTNKNFIYIIFLFFMSCTVYEHSDNSDITSKFILTDYIFSNGKDIEYNLILKTPYKNLVFVKTKDIFISNITIHLKVLENNKIIFSDSWSERITVPYYENTKSLDNIYISKIINLPKQDYKIYISIDDYENHKQWNISNNINCTTTNKSEMAVLYKLDNELKYIDESQYINALDTIWIKYQVNKDDDLDTSNIYIDLYPITNDIFIEDTIFNKKIKILNNDIKSNEINIIPIDITNKKLESIKINLSYKEIFKTRTVKVLNKLNKDYDYKYIIGPMEYILNKNDYFEYENLDSLNKIDYIKKYWNNKYNMELLDQFINRIEYADINFSQFLEGGWDSDRGKIYIIYGEPLTITFDFNQNGEFEIWNYKNNQQFIFINKYGIFELYNRYGF